MIIGYRLLGLFETKTLPVTTEYSTDDRITVVGQRYFQPILDLAQMLLSRPTGEMTSSCLGHHENSYSLCIVLLSVVMFESLVGRVNFKQKSLGIEGKPIQKREPIPKYISRLRKSFTLEKSLSEVFVLRDVIAHGHVWLLESSSTTGQHSQLRNATKGEEYGNNAFKDRVNLKTQRTKALGLHVVPTAIGRQEVVKVLDTIFRTLQFLAHSQLIEPVAFSFPGRFKGHPFDFWSIVDVLRNAD